MWIINCSLLLDQCNNFLSSVNYCSQLDCQFPIWSCIHHSLYFIEFVILFYWEFNFFIHQNFETVLKRGFQDLSSTVNTCISWISVRICTSMCLTITIFLREELVVDEFLVLFSLLSRTFRIVNCLIQRLKGLIS